MALDEGEPAFIRFRQECTRLEATRSFAAVADVALEFARTPGNAYNRGAAALMAAFGFMKTGDDERCIDATALFADKCIEGSDCLTPYSTCDWLMQNFKDNPRVSQVCADIKKKAEGALGDMVRAAM